MEYVAIKAFFGSPLGKLILAAVIVALCIAGFEWWLGDKLAAEYKRGQTDQRVVDAQEKDKYFASLQTAADLFRTGSSHAADGADAASKRAAVNIASAVAKAVDEIKRKPMIVYDETTKKCEFQGPVVSNRWNAINKAANDQTAVTASPAASATGATK